MGLVLREPRFFVAASSLVECQGRMKKLVFWGENGKFDVKVVLRVLENVRLSGQNCVSSIWMVFVRKCACGMPVSDDNTSFLGGKLRIWRRGCAATNAKCATFWGKTKGPRPAQASLLCCCEFPRGMSGSDEKN